MGETHVRWLTCDDSRVRFVSDRRPRTGHVSDVESADEGGVAQAESRRPEVVCGGGRDVVLHGSWAPGKHQQSLHWKIWCLQLRHCGVGHSDQPGALWVWVTLHVGRCEYTFSCIFITNRPVDMDSVLVPHYLITKTAQFLVEDCGLQYGHRT